MGKLKFEISMSLDGYVAGPDQSTDEPLGKGGEDLHEWVFKLAAWRSEHGQEGGEVTASSPLLEQRVANLGAYIMGRNMFGGGPGGWGDGSWEGWWGDDPPYHVPVFVLTHHAREPLEMEGGTTFHFVTDGIESALAQARAAAGEDRDVLLAGGADVANQYLRAGLIDELQINLTPVLLGGGARLFEGVGGGVGPHVEQTRVVEGVGVTHLFYRRVG